MIIKNEGGTYKRPGDGSIWFYPTCDNCGSPLVHPHTCHNPEVRKIRCSDCHREYGEQHLPHCHRQGLVTSASDYGTIEHPRTPEYTPSDRVKESLDVPDGIASLRRVIESQEKALAEWRRKSDEDAGRLLRYRTALEEIATRQVRLGEDCYIALNNCVARAQRELEGTVIRP